MRKRRDNMDGKMKRELMINILLRIITKKMTSLTSNDRGGHTVQIHFLCLDKQKRKRIR